MSNKTYDESKLVPTPLNIVLVSGGAGMEGHGRRLLKELSIGLAQQTSFRVSVALPVGTGLEHELTNYGIQSYVSANDFAKLNADRFQNYGMFAGLMRGMTRLSLSHRFQKDVVNNYVLPLSHKGKVICHFLDYEYLSLALMLRKLERNQAVANVITIHPSDFNQPLSSIAGFYKLMVKLTLRQRLQRASAIICHGRWIEGRLKQQFSLDKPSSIVKTYPIYYPSDHVDGRIDKHQARKLINCPQYRKVILFFGVIRKNKRVDIALRTLKSLPEEYTLLLVGKPAEISESEIRSQIQDLNLAERVICNFTYIPEQDIPIYFSAADLMINTHDTSFTSTSGPVNDCRTYRLPVVASDIGQIAEYINYFGVGRTAIPNHPDSFANVITGLLNDPLALAECKSKIELAAEQLSWQACALQHIKAYRRQ